MNYRNSEMKIDQFVSYLNEEKINLSPAFQRGHVWKHADRKKLLKNVIPGKPTPAIFLYKEATGSKYSYNILDGKQRLESLILYIGSNRQDIKINEVRGYFYSKRERDAVGFAINIDGKKQTFKQLPEAAVRDFRE